MLGEVGENTLVRTDLSQQTAVALLFAPPPFISHLRNPPSPQNTEMGQFLASIRLSGNPNPFSMAFSEFFSTDSPTLMKLLR